ncbi:MNS1 [Symbiodinium natans]|uniref:alpha-1,2-Mannosidase n=1 Tax=Symbiodinium natans TaxID=878477 RepID=A0A812SUB5_9DINO|nr:MNS1 [Symbiodinium natans]
MTIIDSLTTLWLMGLRREFDEGLAFVERDLDFDTADREISVFEVVIRALGGLLGAHSLSGRQIFLERAVELAERILPALNTSSGLPLPRWNLARGQGKGTYDPRKEPTILAEAGSFQLEFRYLSAVTGDLRYSKAAERASQAIRDAGANGLVPVHLTPAEAGTPQLMPDRLAMGALADSYYEYLLKQWLQSPEETQHRDAWLAVMDALPSLVVPDPRSEGHEGNVKLQLTEKDSQGGRIWKMDHLSCFVPGMIALGLRSMPEDELLKNGRNDTWHRMATGLTSTCAHLWMDTQSGLAPEWVFFDKQGSGKKTVPRGAQHSYLRPETAESLFYLYRMTGHARYRKWGKKLFRSIVENSKVDGGYGSVQDVTVLPTKKMDEMQSFVMAETFKYLYLLFSPAEVFDLDRYILNTEAGP